MSVAAAAIAASLAFGTVANAGITIFTDEASFLAALARSGTDTFDDLPLAQVPGPLTRTAGAYGYTATVGPINADFFGGIDGSDPFLSTNNRLDAVTFANFSTGVAAIGGYFFASDIVGAPTTGTSITLNAIGSDGSISDIVLAPNTGTFRGFLSTGSLLSFEVVIGDAAGNWPSIDDLTLGVAPVPEPATWGLMIAGFGIIGAAMRRSAALIA